MALRHVFADPRARAGFQQGARIGLIAQGIVLLAITAVWFFDGLGLWLWKGYAVAYLLGGLIVSYMLYRTYGAKRQVIGVIVGSAVLFAGTILWLPFANLLMVPLGLIAIGALVVSAPSFYTGVRFAGVVLAGSILISVMVALLVVVATAVLPAALTGGASQILAGGSGPFFITFFARIAPIMAPVITGIYVAGWRWALQQRPRP